MFHPSQKCPYNGQSIVKSIECGTAKHCNDQENSGTIASDLKSSYEARSDLRLVFDGCVPPNTFKIDAQQLCVRIFSRLRSTVSCILFALSAAASSNASGILANRAHSIPYDPDDIPLVKRYKKVISRLPSILVSSVKPMCMLLICPGKLRSTLKATDG